MKWHSAVYVIRDDRDESSINHFLISNLSICQVIYNETQVERQPH